MRLEFFGEILEFYNTTVILIYKLTELLATTHLFQIFEVIIFCDS